MATTKSSVFDVLAEKYGKEYLTEGGDKSPLFGGIGINHWLHNDRWEQTARNLLAINSDIKTVHCFGCGLGTVVWWFRSMGADATGSDISEYGIGHPVKEDIKPYLSKFVLGKNAWRKKPVDLVTCMDVLEHVPWDYFSKSLNAVKKACRKYLFITVPLPLPYPEAQGWLKTSKDEVMEHYISRHRKWWIEQIQSIGFAYIEPPLPVNMKEFPFCMDYHNEPMLFERK